MCSSVDKADPVTHSSPHSIEYDNVNNVNGASRDEHEMCVPPGKGVAEFTFDRRASDEERRHQLESVSEIDRNKYLPSFMQYAFVDKTAENIYRKYYENEKKNDFKVLVQVLITINVVLLLILTCLLAFNLPSSPTSALPPSSFESSYPSGYARANGKLKNAHYSTKFQRKMEFVT